MKLRWIIGGISVVIVLGLAASLLYVFSLQSKPEAAQKTETPYKNSSEAFKKDLSDKDKDLMVLIESYGARYQDALADLAKVGTKDWGSKQIDEAHMSLLYADKIGISTQVVSLYNEISSAKAQGVDVDSNPAGVTQEERDKIYERNKEVAQ